MRYALILSATLLGLAACVHAETTAPAPAASTTYVAPAAPVATVVTPAAPPSTTTVIRSP
jgi:hypothetical protein